MNCCQVAWRPIQSVTAVRGPALHATRTSDDISLATLRAPVLRAQSQPAAEGKLLGKRLDSPMWRLRPEVTVLRRRLRGLAACCGLSRSGVWCSWPWTWTPATMATSSEWELCAPMVPDQLCAKSTSCRVIMRYAIVSFEGVQELCSSAIVGQM